MVIPQGKEGCVTVTVVMADYPVGIAVRKRQKPALFRKISGVTSNLLNKSPNVTRVEPKEKSPSPVRNNMLSSHLIIYPPCEGKFTAELQLKNIIGEKQNRLVVKVSGTRLEILFAERTKPNENNNNEKHNEQISKKAKEKNSRLSKKNIFRPFSKLKRRNSDVVESESVEVIGEDKNLKVHGQILLPDYINSETLEFSLNCFGNLNIQADIKGAITPSKVFSRKSFKLDSLFVPDHLVRTMSLHAPNSPVIRNLSSEFSSRHDSGSNVQDSFANQKDSRHCSCQDFFVVGSSSVQSTPSERVSSKSSRRKQNEQKSVHAEVSASQSSENKSRYLAVQIFNMLTPTGSAHFNGLMGSLQLRARSSSSFAHARPLLKELLQKNFTNQELFPAISPLAKPRMRHEFPKDRKDEDQFSPSESLSSLPFSTTRMYEGTTTYQGVFRPLVAVEVKGKKTKKNVTKSCSWELTTCHLDATL